MLTSLFTAVSGMSANGASLSVIGDNIANQNTIGFKGSSMSFGDVLSQSLGGAGGTSQIGRGVQIMSVTPSLAQGSFQSTANGLDLAIDGDGFFMVNNGAARYYTRAGQFVLDKLGRIGNPDGLVLQGYLADTSGNITGTIGSLMVAALQSSATQSSTGSIAVNLNAASTAAAAWTYVGGTTTPPSSAQYNHSTTMTVYDSQGGAHPVNVYFAKSAANTWTAHYVYTNAAGVYQESASQNLTFNTSGALTADNEAAKAFVWGGGVADGSITFNYGTSIGEGGTGLDGTTQFNSDFTVLKLTQNGYGAGALKNIQVGQEGIITGVFTNGQSRSVGQLALGKFIAPAKLAKMGRNLYAESYDSGQPVVGAPNTSGLGKIASNSLELSNVDLANEFVKMITAQRGFEANSKMIATSDMLLQTLVNLR
ncbi:MAG: flagellar hook protein FlgE [Nitrospirota bacterium]